MHSAILYLYGVVEHNPGWLVIAGLVVFTVEPYAEKCRTYVRKKILLRDHPEIVFLPTRPVDLWPTRWAKFVCTNIETCIMFCIRGVLFIAATILRQVQRKLTQWFTNDANLTQVVASLPDATANSTQVAANLPPVSILKRSNPGELGRRDPKKPRVAFKESSNGEVETACRYYIPSPKSSPEPNQKSVAPFPTDRLTVQQRSTATPVPAPYHFENQQQHHTSDDCLTSSNKENMPRRPSQARKSHLAEEKQTRVPMEPVTAPLRQRPTEMGNLAIGSGKNRRTPSAGTRPTASSTVRPWTPRERQQTTLNQLNTLRSKKGTMNDDALSASQTQTLSTSQAASIANFVQSTATENAAHPSHGGLSSAKPSSTSVQFKEGDYSTIPAASNLQFDASAPSVSQDEAQAPRTDSFHFQNFVAPCPTDQKPMQQRATASLDNQQQYHTSDDCLTSSNKENMPRRPSQARKSHLAEEKQTRVPMEPVTAPLRQRPTEMGNLAIGLGKNRRTPSAGTRPTASSTVRPWTPRERQQTTLNQLNTLRSKKGTMNDDALSASQTQTLSTSQAASIANFVQSTATENAAHPSHGGLSSAKPSSTSVQFKEGDYSTIPAASNLQFDASAPSVSQDKAQAPRTDSFHFQKFVAPCPTDQKPMQQRATASLDNQQQHHTSDDCLTSSNKENMPRRPSQARKSHLAEEKQTRVPMEPVTAPLRQRPTEMGNLAIGSGKNRRTPSAGTRPTASSTVRPWTPRERQQTTLNQLNTLRSKKGTMNDDALSASQTQTLSTSQAASIANFVQSTATENAAHPSHGGLSSAKPSSTSVQFKEGDYSTIPAASNLQFDASAPSVSQDKAQAPRTDSFHFQKFVAPCPTDQKPMQQRATASLDNQQQHHTSDDCLTSSNKENMPRRPSQARKSHLAEQKQTRVPMVPVTAPLRQRPTEMGNLAIGLGKNRPLSVADTRFVAANVPTFGYWESRRATVASEPLETPVPFEIGGDRSTTPAKSNSGFGASEPSASQDEGFSRDHPGDLLHEGEPDDDGSVCDNVDEVDSETIDASDGESDHNSPPNVNSRENKAETSSSSNLVCGDGDENFALCDDGSNRKKDSNFIPNVNSREKEAETSSSSNLVCGDGGENFALCDDGSNRNKDSNFIPNVNSREKEVESSSSNLVCGDGGENFALCDDGSNRNKDSNFIPNVNSREKDPKRSTFWMPWEQFENAARENLDEKNKQYVATWKENEEKKKKGKKIFRTAKKEFVMQDNGQESVKLVGYSCCYCHCCLVYFPLDLYRDPSDKAYNPSDDSRLEDHDHIFIQRHDGPFPLPNREFAGSELEKRRATQREKVTKLLKHYREFHPNQDLPVILQKFFTQDMITDEEVCGNCEKHGTNFNDENEVRKAKRRVASERNRRKKKARTV